MVSTYRAGAGAAYYHFLHGNVPGHQIDFIHRPEVPDEPLTRQHFSHLIRLVRYLEPQDCARYAFSIGNLSRDDTHHEPGRGGIALMFGLRIEGAMDHAGRPDPPFLHAAVSVGGAFEANRLLEVIGVLWHRIVSAGAAASWYRRYAEAVTEAPESVPALLGSYIASFDDVPALGSEQALPMWTANDESLPRRIVVVHEDEVPFEVIARCAARLTAVLHRSDIRWTAVTTGREEDLPNGLSVRIVSRSEMGAPEPGERVIALESIPEDERELAAELFGASLLSLRPDRGRAAAWREHWAKEPVEAEVEDDEEEEEEEEETVPLFVSPLAPAMEERLAPVLRFEDVQPTLVSPSEPRASSLRWVGLGLALLSVVGAAMVAWGLSGEEIAAEESSMVTAPAPVPARPAQATPAIEAPPAPSGVDKSEPLAVASGALPSEAEEAKPAPQMQKKAPPRRVENKKEETTILNAPPKFGKKSSTTPYKRQMWMPEEI